MDRETYDRLWHDAVAVRAEVEAALKRSPELFPPAITQGFRLTGRLPESAKLPGIGLRQLRLSNGDVYTFAARRSSCISGCGKGIAPGARPYSPGG